MQYSHQMTDYDRGILGIRSSFPIGAMHWIWFCRTTGRSLHNWVATIQRPCCRSGGRGHRAPSAFRSWKASDDDDDDVDDDDVDDGGGGGDDLMLFWYDIHIAHDNDYDDFDDMEGIDTIDRIDDTDDIDDIDEIRWNIEDGW